MFIPNWTSPDFTAFVDRLAQTIDAAVGEVIVRRGEGVRQELLQRVEGAWRALLAAEAAFWPLIN